MKYIVRVKDYNSYIVKDNLARPELTIFKKYATRFDSAKDAYESIKCFKLKRKEVELQESED